MLSGRTVHLSFIQCAHEYIGDFFVNHAAAVHLRLRSDIQRRESITEYLAFLGIDEQSYGNLCKAYPILREALRNENATDEQIAAALQQERDRVDPGPVDLSNDPIEAMIQLQTDTPKRLAQHYMEVAKTNTRKRS